MATTSMSMFIRHAMGFYPQSPRSCGVVLIAERGGIYGFSKDRPLSEMPHDLLGSDYDMFMNSTWAQPLIEEAKSNLETKIISILKECSE
jgi:hypothetical protein